MNRRNFLTSIISGAAATVAIRTLPFRVFSFASPRHPYVTYSFKDCNGILSMDGIQIATMEQLDAIAKLHGLARKRAIQTDAVWTESDRELRGRILDYRTDSGMWLQASSTKFE